jgi:hypothetical protein
MLGLFLRRTKIMKKLSSFFATILLLIPLSVYGGMGIGGHGPTYGGDPAKPGTVSELKLDHTVETLNADRTILITDKPILWFDCNGSDRNVTLCPMAANSTDLVFTIVNRSDGAGEDLVIKDGNATPVTLFTIGPEQGQRFSCDGTDWETWFDSGVYYDGVNGLISFMTNRFHVISSQLYANAGAALMNEVPTATNPVHIPKNTDLNTGIGWAAADQLSLIAGGVEGIRVASTNSTIKTELHFEDANDTSIIKHVLEPGLGGRLTIGLDETARTMVICDAGDVDTDAGLSIQSHPSFVIFDATLATYARYQYNNISSLAVSQFTISGQLGVNLFMGYDRPSGNAFTLNSKSEKELTDTNAEQSWLYVEPKINQSNSAAYNGLKIKVTETSTGNATTGDGGGTNNLILAGTSTDPDMFKVENDGDLTMSVGKLSVAAMTFTYTADGDITDPLTGSMILLDGDNDSTNEIIDLQNGTTTGQAAYLVAAVDIDADDTCTIGMGDTTCTNCPAIVFNKVGENAHLIWTDSTWVVISLQDAL